MIEIIIPMKPVAKGRPRVTRKGFAYTPKKTRQAEDTIAFYAKIAYVGKPLEGPLAARMEFVIQPPKSWSKKKKQQAIDGFILPTVKPDATNFAKLAEDALNGICYKDDAQIVKLEAGKRYGEQNQVRIIISPI